MNDDDLDVGIGEGSVHIGDTFGPLEAGTAYALYRYGQERQTDRQTRQLINAMNEQESETHVEVHVYQGDEPGVAPVNALDFATADMLDSWDWFIGQAPLKQQIMVYTKSAQIRKAALPHMLLASGYPGVGKTTVARLVAKTMGVKIIELVPPFNIYTLVEAAEQLGDHDILFIDEIHKLADNGARGSEILLKVLEDKIAYLPDGVVVPLNDITVIGATTDRDKLPETVVDRFKIKPYFQAYSWGDLTSIAITFAFRHDAEDVVTDEMALAIGAACRGTPRIIEEMVLACRDLSLTLRRLPTEEEVLAFLEVEPDGLTRVHIHYLTAMYQYFARDARDGGVEYIVGEAAIQQILRETQQGIGRVERFLVERGLIDRTPRGRRLTELGIARAESLVAAGKGAANVS